MSTSPIPFADLANASAQIWPQLRQVLEDDMLAARFIGGAAVAEFEQEWAAYCGAPYAIGTANGTDALALALRAHGIGPGDDVLVPANTFIATAEAVAMVGARPVFADVSDDTLLVTAETLADAITPATRAVMVVHLYGQMANMPAITALAAERGLIVIEDAAQAHGATYDGKPVGGLGHTAGFSFYPGKNLGAFGDAGAVIMHGEAVAKTVRSLANHGRRDGLHYEHDLIGINSRLDAIQARVLSAKLVHLDAWTARRREIVESYHAQLAGHNVRLVTTDPAAKHVHHLAVVRVSERESVRETLLAAGVGVAIHYPVPCHQQPAFASETHRPAPISEQAAGQLLSLPLFPSMTNSQVDRVCEELIKATNSVADINSANRAS